MNVSKPLPLAGAHNVRDLGGYPTEDGKTTKYKAFLRGDSLHGLTKEDEEYLDGYGVRLVIDVRGNNEAFLHPDHIDKKRIKRLHVPLLDHIQSEAMLGKLPDDMGGMYIGLVENSKDGLKEICQYGRGRGRDPLPLHGGKRPHGHHHHAGFEACGGGGRRGPCGLCGFRNLYEGYV